MPDPIDMIIPMLRDMRDETSSGFAAVGQRLDKLEATLDSCRQAPTADLQYADE